jgi:hypothetical protein
MLSSETGWIRKIQAVEMIDLFCSRSLTIMLLQSWLVGNHIHLDFLTQQVNEGCSWVGVLLKFEHGFVGEQSRMDVKSEDMPLSLVVKLTGSFSVNSSAKTSMCNSGLCINYFKRLCLWNLSITTDNFAVSLFKTNCNDSYNKLKVRSRRYCVCWIVLCMDDHHHENLKS